MLRLGFDSVWVQEVKVPVWQRGTREEAFIRSERRVGSIQQENKNRVRVLALGGSVATDPSGLRLSWLRYPM